MMFVMNEELTSGHTGCCFSAEGWGRCMVSAKRLFTAIPGGYSRTLSSCLLSHFKGKRSRGQSVMAPAFSWHDSYPGNTNRLGNQSTNSMPSQLPDPQSSSLFLFPVAVRWPPICHPTHTDESVLMTCKFHKSLLPKSKDSPNSSTVSNSFPRLLLTFHMEKKLIPHPGWNCLSLAIIFPPTLARTP